MNRAEILTWVLEALREQVEMGGEGDPAEVGESTALIGREAPVDSLGLVNVIVDVEQRLLDVGGTTVTIVDERAMSQRHSPFRSVATLTDYIALITTETSPPS